MILRVVDRLLVGAPKYDPSAARPYLTNGTIIECRVNMSEFSPQTNETITVNPAIAAGAL